MSVAFGLRQVLSGHTDDVRAVATISADKEYIFTGSRDQLIRVWEEGGSSITEAAILAGHTNFVVAIAPFSPGANPLVPGVGLVSGSRDKAVFVWDVELRCVAQQFNGHEQQVNAVGVTGGGQVVSGSLDGVMKIWKAGRSIATVQAHDAAILCMLVLGNGDVLTGSGDRTIKQWCGHQAVATYAGHTDSVRCLAELPGTGFVSGSHDGSLRLWVAGHTVQEFLGHSALVYGCAANAVTGMVVSGSEDNTARVWNMAGECLQTVKTPGCAWTVAWTSSGDFVVGCSDANAYVFTQSEERIADAEAVAGLEAKVAAFEAEAKSKDSAGGGGGGIPAHMIKPESALLQPGAKDHETIVVRQNGALWAFSWVAASQTWEKVGEVADGPSDSVSTAKKWYDGQEWDYLFDVDIRDDAPPLKLPFNIGEDPYDAAERFMAKHMLPAAYREQIVAHIQQNAQAVVKPVTEAFDPLTASGAYVPPAGGAPAPLPAFAAGLDPLTAAGAYVPGGQDAGQAAGGAGQLVMVPHRQYQCFAAPLPVAKVAGKVKELSDAIADAGLKLSAAEAAAGGDVDALLQAVASGSGQLSSHMDLLGRLARWPTPQLFPVLDIFRLLVTQPSVARILALDAGPFAADNPGLGGMLARGLHADAPPAALTVALRLLSNCFRETGLRKWLLGHLDAVLDAVAARCAPGHGKPVMTAAATVLLNWSVAAVLGHAAGDEETVARVLSMLTEMIPSVAPDDEESRFRAFLAAGTLCVANDSSKQLAKELGIGDQAATWTGNAGLSDRLGHVLSDVVKVLGV